MCNYKIVSPILVAPCYAMAQTEVSFYLLQNTCCCGLFCHKQSKFIRHAIRVVELYTKKARTAMPHFVN